MNKTNFACAVVALAVILGIGTSHLAASPGVGAEPWFRDFNGPLDNGFAVFGLRDDRSSLSPTFQRDTDLGYLRVRDSVRPGDRGSLTGVPSGGTFTAIGFDTSAIFADVRMTGIINPAGIPEPMLPPDVLDPRNEIGIGLLARGNLFAGSAYAAGINFHNGRPFALILDNRRLEPVNVTSGPSLADLFPDFRQRSYYLQFDVRDVTDMSIGDATRLSLLVFDQPGGTLLVSLEHLDYRRFTNGHTGVFASFRETDASHTYPPLFASFDDVRAVIPEPATGTLAFAAIVSFAAFGAWRRREKMSLRLGRSFRNVCVAGLAIALFFVCASAGWATGTTTTNPPPPPPPPLSTTGWSRDFNGPLDANFLPLGFKFRGGFYEGRGLQLAPTLRHSTDGGALTLWDDVPPSQDGAHTALAVDFRHVFEDVRVTGIINSRGLPAITDPLVTGENSLGFVARGNLPSMSTYYGAVDFRDGSLRMGSVLGGQVYFSDHRVSTNSLDEMFADYKQRDYYLEFWVRTFRGLPEDPDNPCGGQSTPSCPIPGAPGPVVLPDFGPASIGDALLSAKLYDQPGGSLLLSLYWVDENPLTIPGMSGVFVQSFDDTWSNAMLHPKLYGSFDDVTAVVPEPTSGVLAALAGLSSVVAASRIRRRRKRD